MKQLALSSDLVADLLAARCSKGHGGSSTKTLFKSVWARVRSKHRIPSSIKPLAVELDVVGKIGNVSRKGQPVMVDAYGAFLHVSVPPVLLNTNGANVVVASGLDSDNTVKTYSIPKAKLLTLLRDCADLGTEPGGDAAPDDSVTLPHDDAIALNATTGKLHFRA